MRISDPFGRRTFVKIALGMAVVPLAGALTSCGSASAGSGSSAARGGADDIAGQPASPPPLSTDNDKLNFALVLEYVGAQFYHFASKGVGLPVSLLSGAGSAGAVIGGRAASFADAMTAQYVAELAADKLAHVVALRAQLSTLAAAQPEIDFSTGPAGPFSLAAQQAGIVPAGATFDPFADDERFLIGAFILENGLAAAHRALIDGMVSGDAVECMRGILADAIFNGGLVRSRMSALAEDGSASAPLAALLSALDREAAVAGDGDAMDIIGADGEAVPYFRTQEQVRQALRLGSTNSAGGGFLPRGF